MPKGSGSCNVEITLFELSKKVTDPEVELVTAPSPVVESKAMSSGNNKMKYIKIKEIKNQSIKVNKALIDLFINVGIILVDFKIEFGRLITENGNKIILADEISPDSCRLWDKKSLKKLDKDRFRRNLGGLIDAYKEVATRLGIDIKNN